MDAMDYNHHKSTLLDAMDAYGIYVVSPMPVISNDNDIKDFNILNSCIWM